MTVRTRPVRVVRVNRLHTELGNTIVIPRISGPWRDPLKFTITAVTWDPDRKCVVITVAERSDMTIALPPLSTVTIEPGSPA